MLYVRLTFERAHICFFICCIDSIHITITETMVMASLSIACMAPQTGYARYALFAASTTSTPLQTFIYIDFDALCMGRHAAYNQFVARAVCIRMLYVVPPLNSGSHLLVNKQLLSDYYYYISFVLIALAVVDASQNHNIREGKQYYN